VLQAQAFGGQALLSSKERGEEVHGAHKMPKAQKGL